MGPPRPRDNIITPDGTKPCRSTKPRLRAGLFHFNQPPPTTMTMRTKTAPAAMPAATKTCADCTRETPLALMKRCGRSGAPGNICKACDATRSRLRYAANPEATRARRRELYQDPERRRRHRARSRAYRRSARGRRLNAEAVRRWQRRHPHKVKAARLARAAIARGDLVRPATCQALGCSAPPLHAHHERYDRPLDAIFVCRLDHERIHHEGAIALKSGSKRKFARAPRTEPARAAA